MEIRDAISLLSDENIIFILTQRLHHAICFLVLYKVKVYKVRLLWFLKNGWRD